MPRLVNPKGLSFTYTVFPTVPSQCDQNWNVDCADPNSVLIHTLLSLGQAEGATFAEILEHVPVVCPTLTWSEADLHLYLARALRRGLLTTFHGDTFVVNGAMVRVNPINQKYFCLTQLYRC